MSTSADRTGCYDRNDANNNVDDGSYAFGIDDYCQCEAWETIKLKQTVRAILKGEENIEGLDSLRVAIQEYKVVFEGEHSRGLFIAKLDEIISRQKGVEMTSSNTGESVRTVLQ